MKRFLLFLMALMLVLPIQAQKNKKKVKIAAPRPKVGVVLGGGGAKGAAHIGVLKYIDEMGIPVDYVAGTSMGSIMAGLYALGYSPDEMAELIAGMNWSEYIGNKIDRTVMSAEVRKRRSTTVLNVPFSLKSLTQKNSNASFMNELPSAYVNNSSLVNLFNDLCVGYQGETNFNDLPIPFACVATDLVSGEEVVIRSGSVPTAIRASMAIPGVFSPVVIDDKVLVDGGLVNNFPVDVLREMGADIIIGVEVTRNKKVSAEDLKSLPQLMGQLLTNSTSAKRAENRELCDIYIVPDVSGYGMLSFSASAIDTLVNRGYRKAQEYEDQFAVLKRYIDKEAGHPVTKTLRAPKAKNLEFDSVMIRSIEVVGVSDRQNLWMIRKGHLTPGELYSKKEIEKAINIYRGTGAFDEITYTVRESDSAHTEDCDLQSEQYDLSINMKPAQPHVFGVGLHYDTDEGTSLLFSLGLNEKKFGGSKFNASAKLSYSPKISLSYTYSRSSLANFNLAFDYRNDHYKMWVLPEKSLNLRYFQRKYTASISQFHMLNLSTSLGVSYMVTGYDHASMDETSIDTLMYSTSKHIVPYVNIEYDNLDDAYFATKGFYARLTSHYYITPGDRSRNVFDVCYAFKWYYSFGGGNFTISPQFYGRYTKDEIFPCLWNYYGGEVYGRHFDEQMPFVGSDPLTMGGTNVTVLRCDLRYRFLGKHYVTGIYNIALDNFGRYGTENGVGLKYSYNSFIGPISLTAQWSDQKKQVSGYLSIGYYF